MKLKASQRLRAFQSNHNMLMRDVAQVMHENGLKRMPRNYPNPKEWRKKAPEQLMNIVQHQLEELGFKFRKLPIHSMDTKAVESTTIYKSHEYILDLVFRDNELAVDLYF